MIVRYTDEEYKNAKSTDKLALECEHCGKIFYGEKKQITFELKNNRGRLKYCSIDCSAFSHIKKNHFHCENCGKDVEVTDSAYKASKTKHFFCSKSCAASYNNKKRHLTDYTRKKISESVKASYDDGKKSLKNEIREKLNNGSKRHLKEHTCMVCGKKYHTNDKETTRKCCSKECSNYLKKHRKKFLSEEAIKKLSNAGKHSVNIQGENRRSKNEKYFCELCEKHFKNVKHNEPIFNGWDADIIIEDAKIAVLWNGKWHYQKIKTNHSVEQVQNRDKIKIQEIENCGYKPYIIKDMGKYNTQFVEAEFKKLINIVG